MALTDIIEKLEKDQDLLDLLKTFKNMTLGFGVNVIPHITLAQTDYTAVELSHLDDVTTFVSDLMNYDPFITDDMIIQNVKYFYLMANIAYLIKTQLIDKRELTYKGTPLMFVHDRETYIKLETSTSTFNIRFKMYLQAGVLDYITLSIVVPFDMNLPFDHGLTIEAYYGGVPYRVTVDPEDISKDVIQNLLDSF